MALETIVGFVAVVALGAYVQTVTGFAHGLIVMGAVTLLGLAPIAFSAVVVSLTSMFNILVALRSSHHQVDRRTTLLASLGMAPALLLGIALLGYLSGEATHTLRIILGLFILGGGTLLMLRPHPRRTSASGWKDVVMGALGGFFGGLFSTAGPPLVYHMYREPLPIPVIRTTLLAIFGFTTIMRNGVVLLNGDFEMGMLTVSLLCLPAVYLATLLGERYPPPMAEQGMRRLAFGLLTVLGIPLLF